MAQGARNCSSRSAFRRDPSGLCSLLLGRAGRHRRPGCQPRRQTPTPEQLRMLQSLPPEQQQALLEQFGLARRPAGRPGAEPSCRRPSRAPRPAAGRPVTGRQSRGPAVRARSPMTRAGRDRHPGPGRRHGPARSAAPVDDDAARPGRLASGRRAVDRASGPWRPIPTSSTSWVGCVFPGCRNPIPLAGLTARGGH